MIRIPYPIPERDRLALMAAGKLAVQALEHGKLSLWQNRHAAVELILQQLTAKYGMECDE